MFLHFRATEVRQSRLPDILQLKLKPNLTSSRAAHGSRRIVDRDTMYAVLPYPNNQAVVGVGVS